MWSPPFWRDAAERAIATAAQTGIGVLVVDGAGVGLLDVDVPAALSLIGAAALVSILKSLAARRVGTPDTASLVDGGPRHSA